jgi:hypothetical protein
MHSCVALSGRPPGLRPPVSRIRDWVEDGRPWTNEPSPQLGPAAGRLTRRSRSKGKLLHLFGGPPAQRLPEDLAKLRLAQPLRKEAKQGGLLDFQVIVARDGMVCQRRREIRPATRSKKSIGSRPRRHVDECRLQCGLNLSRSPSFPMTEYSTTLLADWVTVCTALGRQRTSDLVVAPA